MTDLYGVIGNPVAHSRSPLMFNPAFENLKMDAVYIRLASRNLEEALEAVRGLGLKGFNVTAPYKGSIIPLLDSIGSEVGSIGVANTVVVDPDGLIGHNTDGYGAALALIEGGVKPKEHRFLILGAGGAAKAAAHELVGKGAKVTIANRSLEKAKELAETLNCGLCSFDETEISEAAGEADVIVSCVSTLERIIPKASIRKEHIILDANYYAMSALVEDAIGAGSEVVDGMEWLLHQGVKAFEIFTSQEAPVEIMRDSLYDFHRRFGNHDVALIGPMGSGKTVVGKALAEKMNARFVDTDQEIQERLGKTITEIFQQHGETTFREYEKRVVEEVFLGRRQVVALGGGAHLDPDNLARLRATAFNVLLWAPIETLIERLKYTDDRPLLAEGSDREDKLAELVSSRSRGYMDAADLVVCTKDLTEDEIAGMIHDEIRSAFGD